MTQHQASAAASARIDAPFAGVVAMDGPSGTGKSTVARRLAQRLGARYLDTGAMYRAATLAVLRAAVPLDDDAAVAAVVKQCQIDISTDPQTPAVALDGVPVDREIRSAEVTGAVSAVSAVAAVREILVAAQQHLIRTRGSSGGEPSAPATGIVVEGRDIGSVVWPRADAKVYLTASAHTRAQRRAGELGTGVDVAAVAADIDRRDRLDSTRASGPLAKAAGAVEVDTTDMNIDQVVNRLVDITLKTQGDA